MVKMGEIGDLNHEEGSKAASRGYFIGGRGFLVSVFGFGFWKKLCRHSRSMSKIVDVCQ
jgi:hypothetical protein